MKKKLTMFLADLLIAVGTWGIGTWGIAAVIPKYLRLLTVSFLC